MKVFKYIKSALLFALTAGMLTTGAVYIEKVIAQPVEPVIAHPEEVSETKSADVSLPETAKADSTEKEPEFVRQKNASDEPVISVTPLAVVANPQAYLDKVVRMKAKFDKFSTLGLDYRAAFRSSDFYISFLIKRDDTWHDIPLSEMKLFLKRDVAEKFIDLKTNDEIEIQGVVFSNALGDAWIDVLELKLIKSAPEENKKK